MLKPTSACPTFSPLEPSEPASSILNVRLSNIQGQRSSFSSLEHAISHHTREHRGKVVRGLRGISDRLCQTLWSHRLYLDWPHKVQRSHRMTQNHPSLPLLLKFSWSYSYLWIPLIFYGVLSNTLVKGLLSVGKKPPTYWIASYRDYDSIPFFPLSGSSVCQPFGIHLQSRLIPHFLTV